MKSARQLLRVDRPIKEHSLCGASSPVPYRTPVASLSRHNARKRVHKPEGTGVMKRGQSSLSREGSAVNCAPRRVYRPSVGSETKSQRPPKQEITGFTAGPIPALARLPPTGYVVGPILDTSDNGLARLGQAMPPT